MKSDLPERTFIFAKSALSFCSDVETRSVVNRSIVSQVLRSATSIGANVEEAQAAQSTADFICRYTIACKEARETNYWFRLIKETNLITSDSIDHLIDESNQLVSILTTILKKLKQAS